jgi:dual oxidase
MNDHYDSMVKLFGKGGRREKVDEDERKVGVFFCGAPPIGMELADRCKMLTVRGRQDENFIEYHFMMEVFG